MSRLQLLLMMTWYYFLPWICSWARAWTPTTRTAAFVGNTPCSSSTTFAWRPRSKIPISFDSKRNHHHHHELSLAATPNKPGSLQPAASFVTPFSEDDENNSESGDEIGNVHIPSGGISVSDEMEAAQQDRFVTNVVPVEESSRGVVAAQLITTSLNSGTLEPVRYLVALSPPQPTIPSPSSTTTTADVSDPTASSSATPFVLVDVPPFSSQLEAQIQSFLASVGGGQLLAILITSRNAIHCDTGTSSSTFTYPRSDYHLRQWKRAFPNAAIVSYRLDTPRDCRDTITQILDGYGPFADTTAASIVNNNRNDTNSNMTFSSSSSFLVETGRPLTYEEWDFGLAQDVLSGKQAPPDDNDKINNNSDSQEDVEGDNMYTPEAIRAREEGKSILAIYTPGHTYGSVSYVFPQVGVCCSGFTLPLEDTRMNNIDEDDDDASLLLQSATTSTGPAIDCRGYITTNQAGIARQMESARKLVKNYCDRFHVVLPSRGDPFFLSGLTLDERRRTLLEIILQYEKIGKVYEQLGITVPDD